jgi:hypothetical protein
MDPFSRIEECARSVPKSGDECSKPNCIADHTGIESTLAVRPKAGVVAAGSCGRTEQCGKNVQLFHRDQ